MLEHPTQVRDAQGIISSLEASPCATLYALKGTDGHIGKGRSAGFRLGDSKYVSYVDDDDDVITDCLPMCLSVLESHGVDAVVTKEYVEYKGVKQLSLFPDGLLPGSIFKLFHARYIHHLIVFRRSSLNPYIDRMERWPGQPEPALIASMLLDGAKFMALDTPGYVWRPNRKNGGHKIPKTKEVRELTLKTLKAGNAK